MEQTYSRGEIYYADLNDTIGSEQSGSRPVIIIQNNIGNKYSPTVIVAAISSKVGVKAKLPTHIYLERGCCLPTPSVILSEQLRTLDKSRLRDYAGKLDSHHMSELDRALVISLGLQSDSCHKKGHSRNEHY